MPLIPWTAQMSVGVEIFDLEHRQIVDQINRLHDAILAGRSRQQLRGIFADLVRQAAEHFAHEEQMLAVTDFQATEEHLAEHDHMLMRLVGRRVEMIPASLIPKDQIWFWTSEWQKKEREADEDIAAGRMKEFASAEDLLKDLRS